MTDPLFAPEYAEPVDTRTCVERMPGTPDAPCHCGRDSCRWPFSPECWNLNETEDDE